MNDHAGRESTCGWEMGNNEFSRSGLTYMLQKVRKQAQNVTAEMRNDPAEKSKGTRLDDYLLK